MDENLKLKSPFGSSSTLRRTPPKADPVKEGEVVAEKINVPRKDGSRNVPLANRKSPIDLHNGNMNSPFGSSSKLRRTPPKSDHVEEYDGGMDKSDIHRKDIIDLAAPETSKGDESATRILKTFSAPPDRMRALEDKDDLPSQNTIEQSPARAKTSTSKKSPKLSTATRRRMDAKNSVNPQQVAAQREREKEQRLKNQIEEDYKDAIQLIRANAEWNEISVALVTVQKAIKIRPDLVLENLHDLTLTLISQVHNLRSSVAKIAIGCFNDMFIKFKKLMDTDLDLTANAILKKIGESGFLVDEAVKCLSSMIENVTNTRVIMVLINNADHKNPVIRLRVALLLESAINSFTDILGSKYVSSLRDMEKLLPVLVRFLREGLAESRNAAKRSIYFLSKFPDFEKAVIKTLSATQIRELKEAIDFVRNKEEKSEDLPARGKLLIVLKFHR